MDGLLVQANFDNVSECCFKLGGSMTYPEQPNRCEYSPDHADRQSSFWRREPVMLVTELCISFVVPDIERDDQDHASSHT